MSAKLNSWSAWLLLVVWIFVNSIGWAAGLAIGATLTWVAVNLPWLNDYAEIEIGIESTSPGNAFVTLTGRNPFREPYLDFLLKVSSGTCA